MTTDQSNKLNSLYERFTTPNKQGPYISQIIVSAPYHSSWNGNRITFTIDIEPNSCKKLKLYNLEKFEINTISNATYSKDDNNCYVIIPIDSSQPIEIITTMLQCAGFEATFQITDYNF